MMKIRKSIASTNEDNNNNTSELKSIGSSSYHHIKTYKMKANNSSSLWRGVLSIGLLLQILVNCGKLITIMLIHNFILSSACFAPPLSGFPHNLNGSPFHFHFIRPFGVYF